MSEDRYAQYRNSLISIIEGYEKVRSRLRAEHQRIIDKTPFKLLFKAIEEKRICDKKRRVHVLNTIIMTYKAEKKGFKIGSQYCKLHKSDIKLIFGIIDGDIKVDNSHGKKIRSPFAERVFPDIERITAKMMKDKLDELVSRPDTTSVEDTVRLLCLLLFQSCFFTNTGQVIAWTYVKYVEDLNMLKYYDWSEVIYRTLIGGLDAKSHKPQNVVGCTVALLYWFCERCKILQPRTEEVANYNQHDDKASTKYREIPRCAKWDLTILENFVNKLSLMSFKKENFIWKELDATLAEMQMIPGLLKDPAGQILEEINDSYFHETFAKRKFIIDRVQAVDEDVSTSKSSNNDEYYIHMNKMTGNEEGQTMCEENQGVMVSPQAGNGQITPDLENGEAVSTDMHCMSEMMKEKDDYIKELKMEVAMLNKKLQESISMKRKRDEDGNYSGGTEQDVNDDINEKNPESQQKEDGPIRKRKEKQIHESKDLLVKVHNLEKTQNENKKKLGKKVNEYEALKSEANGLKRCNANLLDSLKASTTIQQSLESMITTMESRMKELEETNETLKNDNEAEERIRLNEALRDRVKELEDENWRNGDIVGELKATVMELEDRVRLLKEVTETQKSTIEEQNTAIQALNEEIMKSKEQYVDDTELSTAMQENSVVTQSKKRESSSAPQVKKIKI